MENHPDIRDLFASFLPTLGHWVESAANASTALERLRQDGFDVLLTDLWRPNAHGWCLLRELRARGNSPSYVISTSADNCTDTVRLSQAAGCCAHLAQPFRLSEVEQVLEAICLAAGALETTRWLAASDMPGVLIESTYRAEALRLRTEGRLLFAVVARNIALCSRAVEEARRTHARWQTKVPGRQVLKSDRQGFCE